MNSSITGLNLGGPLLEASSKQGVRARESANKAFPFQEHAVRDFLYHADAAEAGGINQMSFLQSFQLADWIKYDNCSRNMTYADIPPK